MIAWIRSYLGASKKLLAQVLVLGVIAVVFAIGLMFVSSVDGLTYCDGTKTEATWKLVSFTPGQTATLVTTNFSTAGMGFWKLLYITNTTGAACTNISVKYAVKISAP